MKHFLILLAFVLFLAFFYEYILRTFGTSAAERFFLFMAFGTLIGIPIIVVILVVLMLKKL